MVFNEFKRCLLLFIQIHIISKNGLSWPHTVGTYTLIVQMCVKSWVGYLPREAGTVFALISQALQTTEYIAVVMYIALFVYWHLDKDSWLEDWWFRFQEEDSQ